MPINFDEILGWDSSYTTFPRLRRSGVTLDMNSSSVFDIGTITMQQRQLNATQFSVQEQIAPLFPPASLREERIQAQNTLSMCHRLIVTLYGEQCRYLYAPKTWWDHFKITFKQWMPMWATEPEFKHVDLRRLYPDIAPTDGRPYILVPVMDNWTPESPCTSAPRQVNYYRD